MTLLATPRSVPGMKQPAPPLVEFFSATDTGRARSNNEDAVAIQEEAALAVLADGMGAFQAQYGRPPRSTAVVTRASSIGKTACP